MGYTSSTVQELKDEFQALADARVLWERYWREIARYVLPHTQHFDRMLVSAPTSSVMNAVVDTPIAAQRSSQVYDMTSLWGIERLSAGILTLKTPESSYWHDLTIDTDFGYEPTYSESAALEKLRNYQFKVRSNPKSGFWSAHRSAIKSMCGFGDGWVYVEEVFGGRVPYRYEFVPLNEIYASLGIDGRPARVFRAFRWSAVQIMEKWPDCSNKKIIDAANDPKRKHDRFLVLHAVKPRPDGAKIGRIGVRSADFASYYCLPDEMYMLGEGGYYEFPYMRYAWGNNGLNAYCEGPIAIALGEVKSLQEMAKNELLATQMLLRPPLAISSKNMQRMNFNAGATNPGLINGDGRPLFAPLNAGVRPDFAQTIMEQRRGTVREMLYLNLWQILLDAPDMTATEALIRAQEKGELLGPVGLSLNDGLATTVDREVGILGRKGAFREGSPLAMPESLQGREVAPVYTSPLDRLRKVGELVGITRLLEIAGQLAPLFPGIKNRFDPDEIIEKAREILGAPVSVLRDRDEADKMSKGEAQLSNLMSGAAAAEAGGRAAQAAGAGMSAVAKGSEAAANAPNLQRMLQQIGMGGGPNAAVPA